MRSVVFASILLAGSVWIIGCLDFGLDDRRYRCGDDPGACGEGWVCSEGFCAKEPGDAGAPQPATCEGENDGDVCDDENPCTNNACDDDGVCVHDPLPNNTPCGEGCLCLDGEPAEPGDCPQGCRSSETCCPDGTCRPTC